MWCDKWCLVLSCLWSPPHSFPSRSDTVQISPFIHLTLYVYTSSPSTHLKCSSVSLQVLMTSTYRSTLTWHQLPRPWPLQSRVWRSGTACGSKSPSPTLSSVRLQSEDKNKKKESITFMNSVCLRGLYRGSIMFSELKPCDLWEGKKSPKYRLECLCWLETCVKLESPAAESQGVITGNYKYFVLFEMKMLFMIWIQVHVVKIQHVTDQQAKTKWSPAVNNTLAFFFFFFKCQREVLIHINSHFCVYSL